MGRVKLIDISQLGPMNTRVPVRQGETMQAYSWSMPGVFSKIHAFVTVL